MDINAEEFLDRLYDCLLPDASSYQIRSTVANVVYQVEALVRNMVTDQDKQYEQWYQEGKARGDWE
jgi:hypothetical protein